MYSEYPNEPVRGVVTVFDNVTGRPVVATAPLAPGYEFAATSPIGPFNGSTCYANGRSYTWHSTTYTPLTEVDLIRYPRVQQLTHRLDLSSNHCAKPNSIVPYCSCATSPTLTYSIEGDEGFSLGSRTEAAEADRLLVTAEPDTLGSGGLADLTVLLGDEHGFEIDPIIVAGFDDATPITLTAPAAGDRGLVVGTDSAATAVTVTYGEARSGDVGYAAGVDSLRYDTPVEVVASGGGLSGSGRLVLLGTDGPGPDSLAVSLAADSLNCGDSTAVRLRTLLADVEKPLDDTTIVLVSALDSLHTRIAWGDTSAVALRIPYGEIAQDSTVWLQTVDCADLSGPIPVGVRVSVDVPWLPEPLAGEATGTLQPEPGEPTGSGGDYEVRLLRQDGTVLPPPGAGGYVMVSKVRPDWLFPLRPQRFNPSFGPFPFENDTPTAPSDSTYYDPDTYQVEVVGLPDSLATEQAAGRYQFAYEVVRGGAVVYSLNASSMFDQAEASKTGEAIPAGAVVSETAGNEGVVRALYFHRLVSNSEPPGGAASCSAWPPASISGDGGECRYDDKERGPLTIPVRLNDTFRVRVLMEPEGGGTPEELGWAEYPVGQPSIENGVDAVRRVDLVWHEYQTAAGDSIPSRPDVAAAKVSEDWAQASIYARSQNSQPTAFTSEGLVMVLQVQVPLAGATVPDSLEIEVVFSDASESNHTISIGYAAGATSEDIARAIVREAIAPMGAGQYSGGADSTSSYRYVSMHRADVAIVRVLNAPSGGVDVTPGLEPLAQTRLGSESSIVAARAIHDRDGSVIDVFAVPRRVIQFGDSTKNTLAFRSEDDHWLFLPPEAADGADDAYAHVLSHEVGHALLDGPFPGPDGGTECTVEPGNDQRPLHHAMYYNLMFCEALGQGEWTGGPKRLSEEQHAHIRLVDDQRRAGTRPTNPHLSSLLKR